MLLEDKVRWEGIAPGDPREDCWCEVCNCVQHWLTQYFVEGIPVVDGEHCLLWVCVYQRPYRMDNGLRTTWYAHTMLEWLKEMLCLTLHMDAAYLCNKAAHQVTCCYGANAAILFVDGE